LNQEAITWLGHSSYHLYFSGKHILVDPVFSGAAAPFSFMIKAFEGSNNYQPNDFEKIDFLILTHDHYDHLDYHTLLKLKPKIKYIYCSLGVAAHLVYWGFDAKIIHELDWWQSKQLDDDIKLTATPARHFSGRGIKRAQKAHSLDTSNSGDACRLSKSVIFSHKLYIVTDAHSAQSKGRKKNVSNQQ
jgi:L-ascorbate metabolism protein UlaG (beta-lactamase superfamily)